MNTTTTMGNQPEFTERIRVLLSDGGIKIDGSAIEGIILALSNGPQPLPIDQRHSVWILSLQQCALAASANTGMRAEVAGAHPQALDALPRVLNIIYLEDQISQAYSWLKQDLLGGQSLQLASAVANAVAYFQPLQSSRLFDKDAAAHPIIADTQESMKDANSVWAIYIRSKQAVIDLSETGSMHGLHANPRALVDLVESLEQYQAQEPGSMLPDTKLLHELSSLCIHVTSQDNYALSRSIKPFEGTDEEIKRKISIWAESLRPSFGKDRTSYNFTIADALLASGILPNAAAVLSVGRWGQSASVASDFSLWVSSLAKRVGEQDVTLPAPLRKQANELLMHMLVYVEKSMRERFVDPAWKSLHDSRHRLGSLLQEAQLRVNALEQNQLELQSHLSNSQERCSELEQSLFTTEDANTQLQEQLTQSASLLANLNDQIRAQEAQAQRAAADHANALAQAVLDHERKVNQIQQDAAAAAKQRDDAHAASLRHLQLQLDAARQESLAAKDVSIKAKEDLSVLQASIGELKLANSMSQTELQAARDTIASLQAAIQASKSKSNKV